MDPFILWALWLIPAISLLITVAAIYQDRAWKRADKIQTAAKIIGVLEVTETDDDGYRKVQYAPRYGFRASDGQDVEAIGVHGLIRPTVGSTVVLWYDRARPEVISFSEGGMGRGGYLSFTLFNLVVFGFVAVFTWLVSR